VDHLVVQHYGVLVRRVTDLRMGTEHTFHYQGFLVIDDLEWGDVAEYGAKVLRVELAEKS